MTVANDLAMTDLVDLLSVDLKVRFNLCLKRLLENLLSSPSRSFDQQRFFLFDACR